MKGEQEKGERGGHQGPGTQPPSHTEAHEVKVSRQVLAQRQGMDEII